MTLSAEELSGVRWVLDRIDQGLAQPNVPGRLGRFLRQYGAGRKQIDRALGDLAKHRRTTGAISGALLGPVHFCPLYEMSVHTQAFPLGEVASTIAISEELGGLQSLVMWLKASAGNQAFTLLRQGAAGIHVSGDFRWTPLSTVTFGESCVESAENPVGWQCARCLKAVADDIARPPHATEYVLDYHLGPPGLKFFRCVAALWDEGQWSVLPALSVPQALVGAHFLPEAIASVAGRTLALLLIYREPWSPDWTIAKASVIDANGALEHAIAWADMRKEIEGSNLDSRIVTGIRVSHRALGLHATLSEAANMTRHLLPSARGVLSWLRG